MENYFKLTTLPAQPLLEPEKFDVYKVTDFNIEPPDILSTDVRKAFLDIGVKVAYCVIFGRQDNSRYTPNRIVHTDLKAVPESGKLEWKRIVCGINWELNNNANEFSWYDTTGIKECYPTQFGTRDLSLNGIHYGRRLQSGLYPGVTKVAGVTITKPTLVRTDFPHLVTYNSTGPVFRKSLSIRFEETWSSWEEAKEVFKTILI